MLFSSLVTLSAASHALAIATPRSEEVKTKSVHVVWEHDKVSSQTSLTVLDDSKAKLLGKSCNDTVSWGNFAKSPISITVDNVGAGTLKFGVKNYTIHSVLEFSGGIVCDRTYSDDEVIVECTVPWTLEFEPKEEASARSLNCLAKRNTEVLRDSSLEKKQVVCPARTEIRLVGDGNPHQNYHYKQLSENLYCGKANACSTSYSITKSYTMGWEASISGAGWISGGFAVQTTMETGNAYQCEAGKGETVCTYYNLAHTAYTVKRVYYNPCVGNSEETYILFSPNQNNKGGGYLCRTGSGCHFQGREFWVKTGRPGGP